MTMTKKIALALALTACGTPRVYAPEPAAPTTVAPASPAPCARLVEVPVGRVYYTGTSCDDTAWLELPRGPQSICVEQIAVLDSRRYYVLDEQMAPVEAHSYRDAGGHCYEVRPPYHLPSAQHVVNQ